jgi:hypothetical protein
MKVELRVSASIFPKLYMMIWIVLAVISPFIAFVCWYAKGQGIIAIFIHL